MDWTLSITLFKQCLMCLMKLHSTTRRQGCSGSILIIKGKKKQEMLTEAQKLQAFTERQPTLQLWRKVLTQNNNNFTLLLWASGHHCWRHGSSRTEINHIFKALLSDSVTAAGYSRRQGTGARCAPVCTCKNAIFGYADRRDAFEVLSRAE